MAFPDVISGNDLINKHAATFSFSDMTASREVNINTSNDEDINNSISNTIQQDSSASSSSDEEEVFEVYDGLGQVINLEPNSRKVESKVPLIKRRGHRGQYKKSSVLLNWCDTTDWTGHNTTAISCYMHCSSYVQELST